jgi:preprotein translocase subunit SecG
MTTPFLLVTILFVIVSVAMILIILVQRPAGGGLAGAFGGAGGAGAETVFGGRVGDALTWATVVGFVLYLTIAVSLNLLESTTPLTAVDGGPPAMERAPGTTVEIPGTVTDENFLMDGPEGVQPIFTPTDPLPGDPAVVPDGPTDAPTQPLETLDDQPGAEDSEGDETR